MEEDLKTYKVSVEGSATSVMTTPLDPPKEPKAICCLLLIGDRDFNDGFYAQYPESSSVRLYEVTTEQYLPPRCRKPRKRTVETLLGEWTLGDFR